MRQRLRKTRISSSKGRPAPPATQKQPLLPKPADTLFAGQQQPAFFRARYPNSPAEVFIHSDTRAESMAEYFNARAFTYRNHIFFNRNEYRPGTSEGRQLLAHELTHVAQNRPVIARKPKDKAPEPPKKTKKELEAELKDTQERMKRMLQVWKDLHDFFPGEGRKVAGSGTDDAVDYLTTSFKEGEEVKGGVTYHYSAPIIKAGKKYAIEPDVDKRKAAMKAELEKIDGWRYNTWRIDDGDVSNSTITSKLSALNVLEKAEYLKKLQEKSKYIANSVLQEYIRKLMPSTPLSQGATPTADGGYELQFDNITIKVLPDQFNSSEADPGGGVTKITPVSGNTYPGTPAWKSKGGVVTEITNPPQKIHPVFHVQTHYAADADPAGDSGYGYGTTDDHISAKTTSLRFHEGSHGSVFIGYVRDHIGSTPYPEYTAAVGDSEADLKQHHQDFAAARDAFKAMLDAALKQSLLEVDCAGKTIEEYHQEQGTTTKVKCHP